jgi:hypothetical protein
MATGAEVFIRKLTLELDELANKYNKTKDPGIRDQWYKLVKTVYHYPEPREDSPPKRGRKKKLDKVAIR